LKKQLFVSVLLILNISCKTYKAERVYFFDDSSKKQPTSIKLKIPKRGLVNRQEVSATSLIDRQINYFYKDSSLFNLNTDIPALGHFEKDLSGMNGKGLHWRSFSNERIIINYNNANKERKVEFDNIIKSAARKLAD
jgi:hypothetical protein